MLLYPFPKFNVTAGGNKFLIQIKLFGLKSSVHDEIIYLAPRCAVT